MMSFDDLRVVGFPGTYGDACGYTFPIVRHVLTDQYFDLSIAEPSEMDGTTGLRGLRASVTFEEAAPEPDNIYSKREMDAFFEEGKLTRLPEEVPACPDVVVVYVTQRFLDAIEQTEPSSVIPEHNLEWQSLPDEDDNLWVTCASGKVAEQAFEHWARLLMTRCSSLLVDFFRQGHQYVFGEEGQLVSREIGELCDVALTAAQDNRDLKSRIYLLYGVTFQSAAKPEAEHDPLHNLYSLFVRPEFTTRDGHTLWEFETFCEQVRSMDYRLRMLAEHEKPIDPLPARLVEWLNFIGAEEGDYRSLDDLVKEVEIRIEHVKKQRTFREQLEYAQGIAEEWRLRNPVGPEVIERFMRAMELSAQVEDLRVRLDYEFIKALAGEPAFYLYGWNSNNLKNKNINTATFSQTIEKLSEIGVKHGPLASQIAKPRAVTVSA